jgi:hypothetical protein
MASRALVSLLPFVIFAMSACKVPDAKSPAEPPPASEGAAPDAPGSPGAAPNAPGASSSSEVPSAVPGAVPGSAATPGATAAPGAQNERPGPPLPELRVKSFGLHVGGAAKDSELRKEVQRTLERGFGRYLDCYRLVEAPGSEGTFRADLRVAAEGGKPKVELPQSALRGEAFRACMVKAFESARFDPPSSGRAIVVSYSVKFSFGW